MKNYQYYIVDFPILINEWDYENNKGLNPKYISYGSDKIVSWKCSNCGNKWDARVKSRKKGEGTGCPVCAIRRRMGKTNKKNLSEEYNLAINAPQLLSEWNKEKNINISPHELTPHSMKSVWWTCEKCGNDWKSKVAYRYLGSGCPYCSGHKPIKGVNDLATVFPMLAEEWDYEENGNLRPDKVLPYSSKRANWKCKECGGKWDAIIHSRSNGAGCPYCSGRKVLVGFNDLATVNPELAKEWNYKLNDNLKPQDVFPKSKLHVWWKCINCEFEWRATVESRSEGLGRCRICRNREKK